MRGLLPGLLAVLLFATPGTAQAPRDLKAQGAATADIGFLKGRWLERSSGGGNSRTLTHAPVAWRVDQR